MILKGIVQSEPEALDGKRITFLLVYEENQQQISCMSSLRFDPLFGIIKGERFALTGHWATDPSTGREGYFVFDTVSRLNPVTLTE